MNSGNASFWGKLGIAVIAAVIVGLIGSTVVFERHVSQQKALFYQLQLLRTSIRLFKAIKHRNPLSLEELSTEKFRFEGESQYQSFLAYARFGQGGKIVDPFGSPYRYFPVSGWVESQTKGYQSW